MLSFRRYLLACALLVSASTLSSGTTWPTTISTVMRQPASEPNIRALYRAIRALTGSEFLNDTGTRLA